MKTYANILANYQDAPIQSVNLDGFETYLDKKTKEITRKYKENKQVNDLEKNDIVTLNLTSDLSKYNRKGLKIGLGQNLYSKELEEQLLGCKVNEQIECIIHEHKVIVEILECIRMIYPLLTDEMVQEFTKNHDDYPSLNTIQEFVDYHKNVYQKERYQQTLFQNMDAVLNYVITHSDWEFDEKEIQELENEMLEEMSQNLKNEGKSFDSLSNTEFQMMFQINNYEELKKEIHHMAEYYSASSYIQSILANKDPKEYTILEIYEFGWDTLENYVKEHMK